MTAPGIVWSGRPLPLGALLPRARLVVHHGGLGIAQAALRAGTPQIVLPTGLEQLVTAAGLRGMNVAEAFLADAALAVARLDAALHQAADVRMMAEPAPR